MTIHAAIELQLVVVLLRTGMWRRGYGAAPAPVSFVRRAARP